MFEAAIIYKLSTISLLPQEINISPENFTIDERFHVYKLEVWLDKILLDETYEITIKEKKVNNNNKVLVLANKTFRYFTKELFNKLKVARLKIILLRGTSKWEQSQEMQRFNIVLSQYSYEYCKDKYNQFREHSVGTLKGGFFHYKILCEYEQQFVAQKQEVKQKNQVNINKSQKTHNTYNDDAQIRILPINSLPQDYDFQEHPSDVFIELQQLKPVFRHQSYDYDKMRIKIQGSFVNVEQSDSQDNSVIRQNRKLKDSTKNVYTYMYYTYFIICLILFIIQMSPRKKT